MLSRNDTMTITQNHETKEECMGPLRFELRTSAMSRRRHNQLDHEPLCLHTLVCGYKKYLFCFHHLPRFTGHMPEFCFTFQICA